MLNPEDMRVIQDALKVYAERLAYEAAYFEHEGETELVQQVLNEQDQLERAQEPLLALLREYPVLAQALAHAIREY